MQGPPGFCPSKRGVHTHPGFGLANQRCMIEGTIIRAWLWPNREGRSVTELSEDKLTDHFPPWYVQPFGTPSLMPSDGFPDRLLSEDAPVREASEYGAEDASHHLLDSSSNCIATYSYTGVSKRFWGTCRGCDVGSILQQQF